NRDGHSSFEQGLVFAAQTGRLMNFESQPMPRGMHKFLFEATYFKNFARRGVNLVRSYSRTNRRYRGKLSVEHRAIHLAQLCLGLTQEQDARHIARVARPARAHIYQ